MQKTPLRLAAIAALLCVAPTDAQAYPVLKGTHEIRSSLGATARIGSGRRQESQFQVGLDWGYSLNGPLGLVLGTWVGVGDGFLGAEVHLGLKYRFVNFSRRVVPYAAGGLGFTMGFSPPLLHRDQNNTIPIEGSDDPLFGIGVRLGGGIDYFVTARTVTGVQLMVDLGPHFSPGTGFFGSIQITAGVAFLL